jgi:curli biogenesis system outer membrane secretion channel CsgG
MKSLRFDWPLQPIVLVFLCSVIAAQQSQTKVAVKTFENPANLSRSTIGNALTDILTTELQNTGKFDVLERANIDELTKEINFGYSDNAKPGTFASKGGMLGAQYLLMGKVTNFSYSETRGQRQKINLLGPNTVQTVFKQQADVRVDFRLIDVATGQTVISQAGEAHKTDTSNVSQMESWYRTISSGSIISESSSDLIGKATVEAVKDVVRKLNSLSASVREASQEASVSQSLDRLASAQGALLGDEGSGVWVVSIGSGSGLQKGDRLKVTHENVTKDKSGNVIYRKPVEIGVMEVTDVSMTDHAEAKLLVGGAASPQVNDIVRADVDFGRSLRGAGVPSGTYAASLAPPAGTGVSRDPRLEEHLRRADSYLTDRFWSQALNEYSQAAAFSPSDARVLQGQAFAHYMMGDFLEGEDTAEKLLRGSSQFSIPVAHYHSTSLCTGTLVLQQGKLTYKSDKGDGFDVAAASLTSIDVHKLSKPFMANEKAPDWTVIEIHWRDPGGHEKKYEILPYMYSRQQSLQGKNFASAFPMDDSDLGEMSKIEQSIVKLAQEHMK